MSRAGCVLVSFGLESGAQRLLQTVGKHVELGEATAILARCRRHGIATRATLVYDLPTETLGDLGRTIALLGSAAIDLATFWPLELLPSSPMIQTMEGCLVPASVPYGLPARQRSIGERLLLGGKHRFFGALNAFYHHKAMVLGKRLGLAPATDPSA